MRKIMKKLRLSANEIIKEAEREVKKYFDSHDTGFIRKWGKL